MSTWDGYNQSIIANRFQKSFMVNYIDLSGRLLVRQDASLNNRLFVENDASFMGNLYVDDILRTNITFQSDDLSLNNRIFVQNDASFMGNLYVSDILTANTKLISVGDTSLNSNVIINKDISCNGNISIGRNITVFGNLAVKNYTATSVINTTTTNYSLAVVEDISLNGRLSVSSDTSLNGAVVISKDISLNGNFICNTAIFNDCSINGINIRTRNVRLNTGLGNSVLVNTTGNTNTGVGYQALQSQTTGSANTGFGYQSITTSTNNSYITGFGYQALTSGAADQNTGIGALAGSTNSLGSTYIGYNTKVQGTTITYATAIGANTIASVAGEMVLGTTAETVIIPRIQRYITPLIMIRTASNAQTFTSGNTSTAILWVTANYTSAEIPLTYSAGIFTNVANATIGVYVTCSFSFAPNSTGERAIWIFHSNATYGRMCMAFCTTAGSIEPTALNTSGSFLLAPTETFAVIGFQNSAATIGASTAFNGSHASRISITVF